MDDVTSTAYVTNRNITLNYSVHYVILQTRRVLMVGNHMCVKSLRLDVFLATEAMRLTSCVCINSNRCDA